MTKNPCPHLESLLPSLSSGYDARHLTYYHTLTDIPDDEENHPAPYFASIEDVRKFTQTLTAFSLNQLEIDVVVGRMVYRKTYAQLAKDWGDNIDPKDVYRVYQAAMNTIKQELE